MRSLQLLRILGFLEGVSYLLLFGVGMPLKYMMSMPEPNYVIGMAHGVLFVAYCAVLVWVKTELNWSMGKTSLAFLASLLPFGTFVADVKLFRQKTNS